VRISIPYICEGEVLRVNETPPSGSDPLAAAGKVASVLGVSLGKSPKMRPIVSYICSVLLADGETIICSNVIDSTMFGGIDDYFQIRRRVTEDNCKFAMGKAEDMMANVGDRVYIAFVGGNVNNPVIIGSAQHPNQVNRFSEGVNGSTKPQAFFRYLGASFVIDEDGQVTFTHFGAPKIKYTGSMPTLDMFSMPVDIGSITSSGYEGFEEGSEVLDEDESDAVIPQDYRFKTTWEILKSGMYRVRDSIGQNITIDPEASTIEITNMGLKSTDPVDGGLLGSALAALGGGGEDAEIIRFDKVAQSIFINSRKLMTIYTAGNREDTTQGDYIKEVQGNETVTIMGDQVFDVYGGVKRSVYGDLSDVISGSVTVEISGDYNTTIGNVALPGNMSLVVSGDLNENVTGNITVSSKGGLSSDFLNDINISTKKSFTLETMLGITGTVKTGDIFFSETMGGAVKISGGKAEIGGKATGIFKSVGEILDQLDAILTAISSMTVPTGVGPSGPPLNIADFIKAQVQLKTISTKLKTVTGSL